MGRKTEKRPLDEKQLARIINVATRKGADAKKINLFLRYTGAHPSVLCEPRYNLREETNEYNKLEIVWDRPKKEGKVARTSILKSQEIDFDVGEFAKELQRRKRKRSRQYIHDIVKRTAEEAGIPNISPMTYRHSLGVELLKKGVRRDSVQQILNCSDKVLRTYLKFVPKDLNEELENIGW
ncbi:tyrosine-type recombinase/integrase [Candidatus Pacearchaeota archaeon]|nr:tyrosine-type recombinase/integrase [Candidatus Pacearchaeota archaeon]